jgi:hypothetical protein
MNPANICHTVLRAIAPPLQILAKPMHQLIAQTAPPWEYPLAIAHMAMQK